MVRALSVDQTIRLAVDCRSVRCRRTGAYTDPRNAVISTGWVRMRHPVVFVGPSPSDRFACIGLDYWSIRSWWKRGKLEIILKGSSLWGQRLEVTPTHCHPQYCRCNSSSRSNRDCRTGCSAPAAYLERRSSLETTADVRNAFVLFSIFCLTERDVSVFEFRTNQIDLPFFTRTAQQQNGNDGTQKDHCAQSDDCDLIERRSG